MNTLFYAGCATSVLVTSAGMGEMVMQVLVGSVSLINISSSRKKRGKTHSCSVVYYFNFILRLYRLKVATASHCVEWSLLALGSSSSLVSCCSIECTEITSQVRCAECLCWVSFYTTPPSSKLNSICIPTGTTKKSTMVEEPTTEQTVSGSTEQKENTSSWELKYYTVCQQILQIFLQYLPNEHCADILSLCSTWHIFLLILSRAFRFFSPVWEFQ